MGCPNWITTSLEEAEVTLSIDWNYAADTVTIEYDRMQTSAKQIIDIIKALNRYDVVVVKESQRMGYSTNKISKLYIPDQSLGTIRDTLANALFTRQSIIIVFEALWCGACKQLKSQTLQNDKIALMLSEQQVVYIDVDCYPELAKTYGVISVPDVFFFNSDGYLMDRLTNVETAEEFIGRLNRLYHEC